MTRLGRGRVLRLNDGLVSIGPFEDQLYRTPSLKLLIQC